MNINRRQVTAGMLALAAGSLGGSRMAGAQAGPIRIGVITALSGFAQIYGDAQKIGAEIAAKSINDAGGIGGRQLEIVFRDDGGKSDATVAAYRELVADGVKYFLAGPISASAVALAPLFKDTDTLLVAAGPNNLSVTHELFNPNIFRLQLTSIPVFTGLGKVLAEKKPDVQEWVAISSDQKANIDLSKVFMRSLQKAHKEKGVDIKIHDIVLTKAGAGDFRSNVSQILRSGATGVLNSLVGSDSLTFYMQAKSLGLDQRVKAFADVGANPNSMMTIATSTPASMWTPTYWYPQGDLENKVSQSVYQEAVKIAKTPYPYGFIALSHDAVLAIAEAIKTAGSDKVADLIPALEMNEPLGAAGPIRFRKEDHTYLGMMNFIEIGADASAKEGIAIKDDVKLDSAPVMEPATPGKAYVIE